jgi:urea transporter
VSIGARCALCDLSSVQPGHYHIYAKKPESINIKLRGRYLCLRIGAALRAIESSSGPARYTAAMSGRRRELILATLTAVAGALVGAVIGYLVADFVDRSAPDLAALLAGWATGSVAAGLTSYAAAKLFSDNAAPLAFSVFAFTGVVVYPGIALYAVFEPPLRALLVFGAVLARVFSGVLVTRLDPAS